VRFADDEAVVALVRRLLAPTGRRIDPAAPWVDARLPDGTRLHAVLAPVATRGTCVSLRTLRRQRMGLPDLVRLGTLDTTLAAWLAAAVRARLAVVISGGTGTGKTTLLSCLLGLVDPVERVVLVEDAAELRPECPHLVALEARRANVDGAGEITLRDLVRQAMRMRPDRLVVGEVRGEEVVDMLAALNTGHEGGLTTVHANAAADVPARFEALAGLPQAALHAQLAAALDVGVHLVRGRDGTRRVREISVLQRDPGGLVRTVPALERTGEAARRGPAYGELVRLLGTRGVDAPGSPP
jgi:pilus assembly protein CpaF